MPLYPLDITPVWGIRDPFSLASHLLGALLSVPALLALLRAARRQGLAGWAISGLAAYGLSMFLAFLASSVFHYTAEESVLLKKLDHAAIFLVIGSTCMALYGALKARWCVPLVLATWLVLAVALVMKMLIWPMPLWMTAFTYALVGSLSGSGIAAVIRTFQPGSLRPLLLGILLLLVGAVTFASERPILWPGVIEGHEVFHVLVLLAWALHFSFIYRNCTTPEGLRALMVDTQHNLRA
jgi:hemolysin III